MRKPSIPHLQRSAAHPVKGTVILADHLVQHFLVRLRTTDKEGDGADQDAEDKSAEQQTLTKATERGIYYLGSALFSQCA